MVGADVVAVGEQVRREAMAQAVEGRVFGDPRPLDGGLEGSLDVPLVEVVAVLVARRAVEEAAGCRVDSPPAQPYTVSSLDR